MSATIQIVPTSAIPKYKQIVNSIIKGIERQSIGLNERLPSINEVSIEFDVSRDTVEKAYKQLKKEGVIFSVPGKGYFTAQTNLKKERRILLVFNKLSAYKKMIFEGFVNTIGQAGQIDFQVYHENYEWFEKIITEKAGQYTDYVILPSFKGEEELRARNLLNGLLKKERIWLLNTNMSGLTDSYGAVFQNYDEDIYCALTEACHCFSRYRKIKLVFPTYSNYSRGIIRGFQRFCLEHLIESEVIYKNFEEEDIEKNCCYLIILDHDLVTLVKKIKEKGWTTGQEIGILAYNDSPLKEVLLDGITVMSTDHVAMGRQLAVMLKEGIHEKVENSFTLINRKSL
jgi:DNA-binding transcriptional regulator YhcF (GntR family)